VTRLLSSVDELEWAAYVRPGDRVVWGQASAEPVILTESLIAQRGSVGGFTCFLGLPATSTCRPEHADFVTFESYTAGAANRALWQAGCLDILPVPYSSLPSLMRTRQYPVDVVLLLLAPPDGAGRYMMGLANEYLSAAVDGARTVIAAVSDQVPRVQSSRRLTDDDLDVVVECGRAPAPLSH
jgi:acyl-CoA hydrolase